MVEVSINLVLFSPLITAIKTASLDLKLLVQSDCVTSSSFKLP